MFGHNSSPASSVVGVPPAALGTSPGRGADALLSPEMERVIELAVARAVAAALAGQRRGPADSRKDWLGVREMVPHMPPGARSESTVRRWIKAGLLRAEKRGGSWTIDPGQAFVAVNRQGDGATQVRAYLATWTLKQAERKVRVRGKLLGSKRRSRA